jgi:TetR/AcrR family transcriptional repressor of nem operon
MARTGRPREFDADAALEQAKDLFWTRGYAATSIPDLLDTLAIQRGSLYAAFGDKQSLFLKALALYVRQSEEHLERALAADPVLPALREALGDPVRLIDRSLSNAEAGAGARGCLVANSAVEVAPSDAAVRELIVAAHGATVRIFAEALGRAQAAGEVRTDATPELQARMLLMLMQGYGVVARTGVDTAPLTAAIQVAVDGLAA